MSFKLCPIMVNKSFDKESGVSAVKLDFYKKTATVSYNLDKTQLEEIPKVTTSADYPSIVHKWPYDEQSYSFICADLPLLWLCQTGSHAYWCLSVLLWVH